MQGQAQEAAVQAIRYITYVEAQDIHAHRNLLADLLHRTRLLVMHSQPHFMSGSTCPKMYLPPMRLYREFTGYATVSGSPHYGLQRHPLMI